MASSKDGAASSNRSARGIQEESIEQGFQVIVRDGIPGLLNRYEQIWHW